jgi:voltage-gated potassium channel
MSSLLRHRFKLLLTSLVLLLLITPLLLDVFTSITPEAGRLVFYGASTWAWLAAILIVASRRGALILALGLLLPSLLLELTAFTWPGMSVVWHHGLRILFLCLIIGKLFSDLFQPGPVTFDIICASLCIYLLLGVVWANVFVILDTVVPGAVVVTNPSVGAPAVEAYRELRMLYFSLITITTVGYGDIVPTTNSARMFAATEAIVGQAYLLVMVSRLVALHASQTLPAPPFSEPKTTASRAARTPTPVIQENYHE